MNTRMIMVVYLTVLILISISATKEAEETDLTSLPTSGPPLSYEEIGQLVEILNFMRREIQDGELTILHHSPLGSDEKNLKYSQAQLNVWKEKLQKVRNSNERKAVLDHIRIHEEYIKMSKNGVFSAHDEARNVTFRVWQERSDDELKKAYSARIQIRDRRDYGRNESYRYFKTIIFNAEKSLDLYHSGTSGRAYIQYPHPIASFFPYHLAGRLTNPLDSAKIERGYRENVDDTSLIVLELKPTPVATIPGINAIKKIWINPNTGFSIVRQGIYYLISGKPELVSYSIYENHKKFAGEIWFPTKLKYVRLMGEKKEVVSWLILEAEFNLGLPESLFDFTKADLILAGISRIQEG